MATTFRADIVAGIMSVLNAYCTAHPDQLVRAYRAKPLNVAAGDLPAAYVDLRNEVVTHSEGVRVRVMSPTIVVVDRAIDNLETGDRMDPLIDGWWTPLPPCRSCRRPRSGTAWTSAISPSRSGNTSTRASA